VTAISATPVPGVEVIPPTPSLAELLASADLVVSAAGVTLLELCCIGVPAALVRIADNQKAGYEAAVTQGLAAGLGTDPRDHLPELRALLLHPEQRKAMADKAMAVVDGRGADRVLDAMGFDPQIREATESDSGLLLAWRNDPETRAWSRTTDPVAPADHSEWLARALDDPGRRLLIAEYDHEPVGTVRLDRDDDHWEISITVAPEARGRGLAVPVLLAAERSIDRTTIRACVNRDNAASIAVFRRAGYRTLTTDGQWLWFHKPV
jgi:RimJ/RimL family protein N-acetyltransferase